MNFSRAGLPEVYLEPDSANQYQSAAAPRPSFFFPSLPIAILYWFWLSCLFAASRSFARFPTVFFFAGGVRLLQA